jgi:hypothetical protein
LTARDPSTWSRKTWATLEADLAELEAEEGIPDPMDAVREHIRRQDIRDTAQAAWKASQEETP